MTRFTRGTILACIGLALLAPVVSSRATGESADLEVYWTAAQRAAGAEPLYRAADEHYQFKYLPAFAVLAAPLGSLSWQAARVTWFTASAVLIVLLVSLSIALPAQQRMPTWILVAGVIVTMGKFYGHELVLGQVNALFGVAVVLALLGLKAGREALAGALLALAVVVKPYAVIFLPWLVARRRIPSIVTAVAGLAGILALPAILYGVSGTIDLHLAWWRTVTGSTAPNLTNNDNVSIAALYAKWFGIGRLAAMLALITTGGVLGLLAVVFWKRRPVAFPEGLEGALLLTCIPLLSPQGWDYVFLISTPAIVYLLNAQGSLPTWLRGLTLLAMAVIGLSLFDLLGRAAYSTFMALSIITLCYFVVLASLATLRLRAAA